ncbi:MAG: hypothetical protein PVF73_12470 [Bacteroidales bacterium]|jgi:phenylacetate-CoA ligase
MSSRSKRNKRQKILKILRHTPPEKFETAGIKKLRKTMIRAQKTSPAYRNLLEKHEVQIENIRSISDFEQKVPVLTKENYFNAYSYSELLGRNLDKMKLAMSSSGYSRNFAFGFSSEKALRSGRSGIDTTLDYWFDISGRKTFLINCAPMGVHVETSLPLAETSVRSDMALSLLKKISPSYDQTIIAGDPHFLKKLIEEGDEQKINWEKYQVSLIPAQDWLPESLRTYLANRLEIDPDHDDHRGIYSSMGMTELGLNVFHESKYTVAMRRKTIRDKTLGKAFLSPGMAAVPCFFHYYPFRTYIESKEIENREHLIFTVIDKNGILPIIRYNTGDTGRIFTYRSIAGILSGSYPELIPDLKLPVAVMSGRRGSKVEFNGENIFIEDVKEVLYSNFDVSASVTGLIMVKPLEKYLEISVHLKEKTRKTKSLERKVRQLMNDYFPVDVEIRLFGYDEFPGARDMNYERKLSVF